MTRDKMILRLEHIATMTDIRTMTEEQTAELFAAMREVVDSTNDDTTAHAALQKIEHITRANAAATPNE
jgi:hypothetical protein